MIELTDFPLFEGCGITQPDGDMGDMPQRTFGMFHVPKIALGYPEVVEVEHAIALMTDKNGDLIRDPIKWNDPKDIPADQFDPTVMCLKLYAGLGSGVCHEDVKYFMASHRARWWRYPNGNLTNPGAVSCLLRCVDSSRAWIVFWDFFFLLSALFACARAKIHQGRDGSWLDMDNMLTRCVFSTLVQPTFLSSWARKALVSMYPWAMNLPYVYGLLLHDEQQSALLSAVAWKHRAPQNNRAFGLLWAPLIQDF